MCFGTARTAFAVRADLCCQSIVIAIFPGGRFRHKDEADIALCEEDLVGQQAAGHIAGVGFQMEFAGIAGGKLYMACAPFNRNLVCGGHVIQGDAADASG